MRMKDLRFVFGRFLSMIRNLPVGLNWVRVVSIGAPLAMIGVLLSAVFLFALNKWELFLVDTTAFGKLALDFCFVLLIVFLITETYKQLRLVEATGRQLEGKSETVSFVFAIVVSVASFAAYLYLRQILSG